MKSIRTDEIRIQTNLDSMQEGLSFGKALPVPFYVNFISFALSAQAYYNDRIYTYIYAVTGPKIVWWTSRPQKVEMY